jgi:hypothetical protein
VADPRSSEKLGPMVEEIACAHADVLGKSALEADPLHAGDARCILGPRVLVLLEESAHATVEDRGVLAITPHAHDVELHPDQFRARRIDTGDSVGVGETRRIRIRVAEHRRVQRA